MIVSIHQPEHLPWLGFFDKMRQADIFVLLDTTQYAKDDFQNRNRIRAGDAPAWLTVPVYSKGSSHQLIRDVQVCNEGNWRRRCWGMMRGHYGRAAHFVEHQTFFEGVYAATWTHLLELNLALIMYLKQQLGIATRLVLASEIDVWERGGTQVNLTICRALGATTYLSGTHGRDYLDESGFAEHGIAVAYQEFRHPEYRQLGPGFVSKLSAVDLLFNHGPCSGSILARAGAPVDAAPSAATA